LLVASAKEGKKFKILENGGDSRASADQIVTLRGPTPKTFILISKPVYPGAFTDPKDELSHIDQY